MKKMIKNLMLVAVAAMAFVGCQNDNDEMNATARKVVLEFVAGFDEDTRATFGDKDGNAYPTYWEGNEWVSVTISDDENNFNGYGEVELPDGKETSLTAKISVEFYLEEGQELPAAGTITATVGNFYEGEVMIDEDQSPTEKSVASMSLIASREFTNGDITGEALQFKHAAAYGKMTIPQLADINTDKVVVSFNEGAYTYTIRTSNIGDSNTLWFACPAFDVTDFTVSFVESGVFNYNKSVESLAEGALKFRVGRVSAFTVNNIEKEELAPAISQVFNTMEYLGDSTWKFSNANGYFMTIPFTTAIGDTLVDGIYTAAFGATEDEFEFNANNVRIVYADDTLALTYDQGTWVTSGGVVTVETVDEQIVVSFIGYVCDPTDYSSFLYQGVYDPNFVPNAVEILTVSGDYYDPSIYTNLWIDVAMSAGENYSIFLPLTVGEDGEPFAVIPEGVYTVGAETGKAINDDAHANAESADQYVGLKEGTLTVSHVGEEYKLVLNLTNNNDEVFDLEWQGTIGGQFDWSNDFPHPGYSVQLDTPTNVQATVITSYDEPAIEITWDAVANAYEYYVTCVETDETNTIYHEHECRTVFTSLDYSTEYTITVMAVAPADTIFRDSEVTTVTVTTNAEPVNRNLSFVSAEMTGGNVSWGYVGVTFTAETGDSLYLECNLYSSYLTGTFSGVTGGATAGTIYKDSKFTPSGGSPIFVTDGTVDVVDENPIVEYTMNLTLSDGSTLTATYEGRVEGYSMSAPVEFVSAVAEFDGNWTIVTFSDANGNTLRVPFGTGGVNYLNAGTWDFLYYYSSGYAINYVYYNGDTYIDSCQAVVAHVDGAYDITFTTSNGNYTFNGSIENLVVPGAEPEPEPATEITLTTWNEGEYNPGEYRCNYLVSGNECSMMVWTTTDHGANATSLGYTTNYTIAPAVANVGNYYRFFVQDINVGGETKSIKDTYDTTNNTMSVVNNGDGTFNVTINLELSDGKYIFTYTGGVGLPQLTTPTGLDATSTANEVTVNWVAVANATSYDVTCGAELKNVTGTTATFDGLDAGTTYNISVVAKANGYKDSVAASTTVTTQKGAGVEPDPEPDPEPATVTVTAMTYSGNPISGYSFTYTCANGTNITGTSKSLGTGITYALSTSTDVVFNTLSNIKVGSTVATSVSGTISIDGGANITFNNVVIDGVKYVGSFSM